MKRYDKYKDSAVQWIGQVPEHWTVSRLKFSALGKGCCFIDGDWIESKNISEEGIKYITSGNVGALQYKEQGNGYITQETFKALDCKEVFPEDILISRLNEPISRACIVPELGERIVTCVDNVIFRPNLNLIDKRYIVYFLNSPKYTQNANLIARGATMHRISRTVLGGLSIPLPPLPEQKAIAEWLDERTGRIDRIIATREKQIELLEEMKSAVISRAVTKGLNPDAKMKDSGIEWIGNVPEHWEVIKMNFACKTITDYVASGSFADLRNNVEYLDEPDYAMLVRTADLSGKSNIGNQIYISKRSYDFLRNSNLFGGEVILPNIGASIGDVYVIPKDLYERMSLAPNSIMIKSKSLNKFLFYYFSSKGGRESLELLGMAAAQGKFNKTDLRQLRVPLPSLPEQQEIVSYLDRETEKIEKRIGRLRRQIELLKEYKATLISEAVTGKIKVKCEN